MSTTNTLEPSQKRPRNKHLLVTRFFLFVLPLIIIIGAVGVFMAMSALKPKPEEKEEAVKAVPVLTAQVRTEDIVLKVSTQGEVQPRTKINIVPQISGKITYMSPKFIEGGSFNRGDVLVRIEPTEYALRVTQARAALAQAETALTRETSESMIARKDWEDIGTGGQATALTLREPQMAEAAARLASAQASLEEAELQLARTTVSAPFTGRVMTRAVNQGEYVVTGTRLGEVYGTDIMDVRIPLTDQDMARVGLDLGYERQNKARGIPTILSATVGGKVRQWRGQIVRTDSNFDSQSRVLFAYVEVEDPFGDGSDNGTPLMPGLFVDAAIEGEALSETLIIPRNGLRGKDQVYIANDDNTLSIRTVSVIASDREQAVLSAGLMRGDTIITSPIRGVAEGMSIAIVDPTKANTDTDETSDANMVNASSDAPTTGDAP